MYRKFTYKPWLIALVSLVPFVLASGHAEAGSAKKPDYTTMSAEELAEYLIFEAKGYDIAAKTQEGGTVGDRLKQDELQKTCSKLKGESVDGETAEKVTEMAAKSIVYPKGGITLGDWKKGQALVQNAFGFRVGKKTDDHSKRETGGMCMNCHQLEKSMVDRSGTVGPSLIEYGKTLGMSEETKKHTYKSIYNPHAIFPCTNMPRFGVNGILTQEKIADIMAYLLDPESPVNK
ncbi:MAG: sulfur oxidation c-type cytochrome SoxX [Pseudomonadota bacterium]